MTFKSWNVCWRVVVILVPASLKNELCAIPTSIVLTIVRWRNSGRCLKAFSYLSVQQTAIDKGRQRCGNVARI